MRQDEICELQVHDVDRAARIVVIRDRKDPRNKAGNAPFHRRSKTSNRCSVACRGRSPRLRRSVSASCGARHLERPMRIAIWTLTGLLASGPLLAPAAESEGQYLQMGIIGNDFIQWQFDTLTKEKCAAVRQSLLSRPEFSPDRIGGSQCSSTSAAARLPFHAEIRNLANGTVLRVDAESLVTCTAVTELVPLNAQPPRFEVISQCTRR